MMNFRKSLNQSESKNKMKKNDKSIIILAVTAILLFSSVIGLNIYSTVRWNKNIFTDIITFTDDGIKFGKQTDFIIDNNPPVPDTNDPYGIKAKFLEYGIDGDYISFIPEYMHFVRTEIQKDKKYTQVSVYYSGKDLRSDKFDKIIFTARQYNSYDDIQQVKIIEKYQSISEINEDGISGIIINYGDFREALIYHKENTIYSIYDTTFNIKKIMKTIKK